MLRASSSSEINQHLHHLFYVLEALHKQAVIPAAPRDPGKHECSQMRMQNDNTERSAAPAGQAARRAHCCKVLPWDPAQSEPPGILRLLCEWAPFSERKAPYILRIMKATTQMWSAHPKIQHFMLLHSTPLQPSSAGKLPKWTSKTGITSIQPIQHSKLQGALLLKNDCHNCLGTNKN